jgi:predicted PurR-regulated permease PerM
MPARRLRVDITGRSILRILVAAALVWTWLRLWQWVLLFVIAAFITVGLDPIVGWLDARRVRRRYGSVLVVVTVAVLLVAFCSLAGAELLSQGKMLGERMDEVQQEITRRVPPDLRQLLPQPENGKAPDQSGGPFTEYAARLGRAVVNGVLSIAIALVLTVYLLIDGRRTYEWLVAFAPASQRPRVRETAGAARDAVVGYVRGNVITSVIAGVTAYIFLRIIGVPAALLLAVLTALFDLIPVLGIFLTVIPMVLLALTVSSTAAIATIVFNAVYNVFENYYLAPKVYGKEMQLSSLAVILAFAVGAELAGVIGALIALPIAAVYPAVENIWLAERLAPEVARDHRRIEQTGEH